MAKKPCVQVEVLVMGMIENNVYIIDSGDGVMVVDPTENAPYIVEKLNGRKLDAIVLTHGHYDHVNGANELRELTGARVIASAVDTPIIEGNASKGRSMGKIIPCPVDQQVEDGDVLEIGSMKWEVLLTPGHTPGGICLFLDSKYGSDPEGAPLLISGDTLFCGTHGRTDFEGGSVDDMAVSLKRLIQLPEETIVLPGHQSLTTIANERRTFAILLRD